MIFFFVFKDRVCLDEVYTEILISLEKLNCGDYSYDDEILALGHLFVQR